MPSGTGNKNLPTWKHDESWPFSGWLATPKAPPKRKNAKKEPREKGGGVPFWILDFFKQQEN